LEKFVPQPRHRSKWFWPVIAAILVIVIIAIVVPLAVILPKKNASSPPSTAVIVPLYLYPLNDSSWAPLYDA
jgi:hypothetical protein